MRKYTKQYKNVLYTFSLQQQVTIPTRKGESFIGHICSNIPNKLIQNKAILTNKISNPEKPYVVISINKFQKKTATNKHTKKVKLTSKVTWRN